MSGTAMVAVTGTLYLPNEKIATLRTRVNRTPKGTAVRGFVNEFRAAAAGQRRGDMRCFLSGVLASQTITCDQSAAVDDTDTLTIAGGTALAVKASPANEDQVSKGATSAAFAANVVAKINAHSAHSKLVWAAVTTSASGIITVYAVVPGPIGNLITLAEVGNGFTLGAAALAGGTSDAMKHYQLGWQSTSHVAG